jgi:acrylyl-CoA reductase (NADPH)
VSLFGIDSVMCPTALRRTAWRRLASDLDRGKLAEMTTEIGLAQVLREAPKILQGRVRGRTLIKIAD